MGERRAKATRSHRRSRASVVPDATLRRDDDGVFHRSWNEQLLLAIDTPVARPRIVESVDDGGPTPGDFSQATPLPLLRLADMGEVQEWVLAFHAAFDLPREPLPTSHVADHLGELRVRLLREEVQEFVEAVDRRDLVAIADALADVVYVAYGSAITYGLDLDAVIREVHRANMSKLDTSGRPVLRYDGKVLKSAEYRPPNVARVIEGQLPLFDPWDHGPNDAMRSNAGG